MGLLFLDTGGVYGTDTEGVRYDGEYLFDENTGFADVKARVTFRQMSKRYSVFQIHTNGPSISPRKSTQSRILEWSL